MADTKAEIARVEKGLREVFEKVIQAIKKG